MRAKNPPTLAQISLGVTPITFPGKGEGDCEGGLIVICRIGMMLADPLFFPE